MSAAQTQSTAQAQGTTQTPGTTTQAQSVDAAQVHGLVKEFDGRRVLDGIDLSIGRGEIVALLGRSGSGKSTLLRTLAGLATPTAGEVSVEGTPTVVFQEPRLIPWQKVAANVVLGDPARRSGKAAALRRALAALSDVGLADHADAWPLTLSGGESQRTALARALVASPTLLLLDEPFGALDALTRLSMHQLLLRLHAEHGFGVLLVTHDVAEAVALADRVAVLEDGRIGAEVAIDLPRPRRVSSPDGARLEERLLGFLGVTER